MISRQIASVFVFAVLVGLCQAQIDPLPGVKLPGLGNLTVDSLVSQKPALTSGFSDARWAVPFLDFMVAQGAGTFTWMPKTGDAWRIPRGMYSGTLQSFCLHAGTYAPTRGEGYLLGKLRGPKAGTVSDILKNYPSHPEIPQYTVQELIWAIQAHTKFDSLDSHIKDAARKLLTSQEIFDLNGGISGLVPPDVMDRVFQRVNNLTRPVADAENAIRGSVTTPGSSYEDLVRVSVRNPADRTEKLIIVAPGRWSFDPRGYFVQILPNKFTSTLINLYVPEFFVLHRDSQGRIDQLASRDSTLSLSYGAASGGQTPILSARIETFGRLLKPHVIANAGWISTGAGDAERRNAIKDSLKSLDVYVSKNSVKNVGSESRQNLRDLGELQIVLSKAVTQNVLSRESRDLIARAWAAAFTDCVKQTRHFSSSPDAHLFASLGLTLGAQLQDPFGTFTSEGSVLLPADPSTQMLGISNLGVSDTGPFTITIYGMRPNDESGTGHAWVSVSDGDRTTTIGLYPVNPAGITGILGEHRYVDDSGTHWDARRSYQVDRNHMIGAYNAIDNWDRNYDIFSNCTDFANFVARGGGISNDQLPPPGVYGDPNDYVNWILSHGGEPNPDGGH